MNAIDLLNQQHDTVDALFNHAERSIRADMKERLFVSIADVLSIRATVEERIFYPTVLDRETEPFLRESLQEQYGIKRLIADLLDTRPGDPRFDHKLTVLRDQFEHQVKEEQESLFPKVRQLFDGDQLRAVGHEMEELMTSLEGTDARYAVKQTTRPFALVRGVQPRLKQTA